jgi:hypothetical protein
MIARRMTLCAVAGILIGLFAFALPAGAMPARGTLYAQKTLSASHVNDPEVSEFVKTVGAGVIRNQAAIEAFRVWMFGQPGFAGSGYVGSIDHLAQKATTIMWYGPRTALLKAIIREGQRRGISVTVQHRTYSLQQIKAAIAAIWKQAAEGKWAGFHVSAIGGVTAAETGLTVEGTYTAVPAARRAPQVRSLTATVQGIPVRVIPGIRASAAGGRHDDVAPFNSGDLMKSEGTGGFCSAGFAVTIGGVHYTETARHCNRQDFVVADSCCGSVPANKKFGTTLELSADGGARVLTGGGYFFMQHLGWDTTSQPLVVVGFGPIGLHDLLCTEGGNSGEHCDIEVTNELVVWNDPGYGNLNTIEGHNDTVAHIAVMQGDSGGPVMSLANTQPGQVLASGMIQAGVGAVSGTGPGECGPAYSYGAGSNLNLCFDNVLFTSTYTIVKNLVGASLYTG